MVARTLTLASSPGSSEACSRLRINGHPPRPAGLPTGPVEVHDAAADRLGVGLDDQARPVELADVVEEQRQGDTRSSASSFGLVRRPPSALRMLARRRYASAWATTCSGESDAIWWA
jgi:hypothetical protein